MFSSLGIFLLFAQAFAQNRSCDFTQNVSPGTTHSIESPADLSNGNYRPGRQCRWLAFAPANYQLRLDCMLQMPQTSGCSGDRLLISTTGDSSLTNAQRYCGRQTLTAIMSNGQNMALGLIAPTNSPGGRFSCSLVAQQVQPPAPCSCGEIKSSQLRIVGGTAAGQNEFSWAAAVIDRRTDRILCGGTIISNRDVLTAAHCVEDISTSDIIISMGDSSLASGLNISVSTVRTHPNYNRNTYDYDVALLRTTTTITYNIGPICLPFKYENTDLTGASITILGWGTNNLLKTTSTIISQSECRRSLPLLTNQQLCIRRPGRDSCQNDSGGPALYIDPTTGTAFAFGIVSFSAPCAKFPGVLTRVQNILPWIVNIAPADYCMKL